MSTEEPLRCLTKFTVTVTLTVQSTTKEKAIAGVRSCFGVSAPRIQRITVNP